MRNNWTKVVSKYEETINGIKRVKIQIQLHKAYRPTFIYSDKPNVDHHTGSKWFTNYTKYRKENQFLHMKSHEEYPHWGPLTHIWLSKLTIGTKPLSKPMLKCYLLDPGNKFQCNRCSYIPMRENAFEDDGPFVSATGC